MKAVYICAFSVALVSLCVVKATVEEEMEKVKKVCLQEVPVTPEEMKKFGLDSVSNVNDAIKCHLKCIMEKQDVLQKGEVDVQSFLKSVETYPSFKNRQAAVMKAADDCKNEKGANDCETAYKLFLCLKNHEADVFGDQ